VALGGNKRTAANSSAYEANRTPNITIVLLMLDRKYPPRFARHANTEPLPRQNLDPTNT